MVEANRQFSADERNILAIVPNLRWPMYTHRYDVVRAFFGEFKITFQVDTNNGRAVSEAENKFFQTGKFLNPIKNGILPGYTRIGAVVCIEEVVRSRPDHAGREREWREHKVLVLHNPNARFKLPLEVWRDAPQLIEEGDRMVWSDGKWVFGEAPREQQDRYIRIWGDDDFWDGVEVPGEPR